jgi:hypothetical protein
MGQMIRRSPSRTDANIMIEIKAIFNRNVALVAFIILACLLLWTIMVKPYANGPAIRSDGVGYQGELRDVHL